MNSHEPPVLVEETLYHYDIATYSWGPMLHELPGRSLQPLRRQEAKTSDSSVIMACRDQLEGWPNEMLAQYIHITIVYIYT